MFALVVLGVGLLFGQGGSGVDQQEAGPALIELVGFNYPPIARAAQVSGTVEINVLLGADGHAESAQVISGPPMLQPAALEAARQSQYRCVGCPGAVNYKVVFVFKAIPTEPPKNCDDPLPTAPEPEWDPSRKQATAYVMETWTCDPAVQITKTFRLVRSAKCLYLWKCGLRPIGD